MSLIPKKQYMKLSPEEKRKVKLALARKLKGRGDYKSALKSMIGGGLAGGALASLMPQFGIPLMLGAKMGAALGATKYLSGSGRYNRAKMTGRRVLRGKGEYYSQGRPMSYERSGNAIDMGQQVPEFLHKTHYTEVCHSEYIQDISSSVNFTNTVFPINPGLAATFPWLATLASNYEEYEFRQLIFYYKTTSALALNSTNTALGVVIGVTNYNVTQSAFTTKQQMENYEFSKSAPPAVSQIFPVECDRRDNVMNHLYIRSGSLGSNQDLRLNDLGNFQIATTGSQAAAVTGELWVSYRVRLYKPSLSSVGNSDILSCHYGKTAFTSSVVSTVTASSCFGTTPPASTSYEVGSNLALTFTSNPNTVTFPASLGQGQFIFWMCWKGAATTLTSPMSISATTNCTFTNLLDNSGVSAISQTSGTTANTRQYSMAFVNITGPSAVITIAAGTIPGTLTSVDVFVTPINPNILTKKQQMLRDSVIRRADDPKYDPFEGKYLDEEDDDEDDHLAEGDHKHGHFRQKTLEHKGDEKEEDDDLEGLSASEIDLILRLRKDKQALKAWADKPSEKHPTLETDYVKVEQATPKTISRSQSTKA